MLQPTIQVPRHLIKDQKKEKEKKRRREYKSIYTLVRGCQRNMKNASLATRYRGILQRESHKSLKCINSLRYRGKNRKRKS